MSSKIDNDDKKCQIFTYSTDAAPTHQVFRLNEMQLVSDLMTALHQQTRCDLEHLYFINLDKGLILGRGDDVAALAGAQLIAVVVPPEFQAQYDAAGRNTISGPTIRAIKCVCSTNRECLVHAYFRLARVQPWLALWANRRVKRSLPRARAREIQLIVVHGEKYANMEHIFALFPGQRDAWGSFLDLTTGKRLVWFFRQAIAVSGVEVNNSKLKTIDEKRVRDFKSHVYLIDCCLACEDRHTCGLRFDANVVTVHCMKEYVSTRSCNVQLEYPRDNVVRLTKSSPTGHRLMLISLTYALFKQLAQLLWDARLRGRVFQQLCAIANVVKHEHATDSSVKYAWTFLYWLLGRPSLKLEFSGLTVTFRHREACMYMLVPKFANRKIQDGRSFHVEKFDHRVQFVVTNGLAGVECVARDRHVQTLLSDKNLAAYCITAGLNE
jgi:hypothetical protein